MEIPSRCNWSRPLYRMYHIIAHITGLPLSYRDTCIIITRLVSLYCNLPCQMLNTVFCVNWYTWQRHKRADALNKILHITYKGLKIVIFFCITLMFNIALKHQYYFCMCEVLFEVVYTLHQIAQVWSGILIHVRASNIYESISSVRNSSWCVLFSYFWQPLLPIDVKCIL